jgi:hypothetical protein
MNASAQNPDDKTLSIMGVFSKCEQVALQNGELDKDTFKNCFTASRAEVERKYPGAFDFMKDGWEFLMVMVGIFLLYYYAVAPKVDTLLSLKKNKIDGSGSGEDFDYGGWVKDIGKSVWSVPTKIAESVTKNMGKK